MLLKCPNVQERAGRLPDEEGNVKTGRGDAVKKHQRLANTVGEPYPLNNEKGAASLFS